MPYVDPRPYEDEDWRVATLAPDLCHYWEPSSKRPDPPVCGLEIAWTETVPARESAAMCRHCQDRYYHNITMPWLG